MTQLQPAASELLECRQLVRDRKLPDAIQRLQKLLEEHPGQDDALELLGMTFFMARQYEAARDAFERLTRSDPMHLNGWVNLGAVCNRLGEHRKAVDALRRAVQRDRKCAEGYYNMGIAQKAMNMNTMAISAYKEAIRLKPSLIEAHLNLGNIYVEMKNMGLAMQCFQNALKQDPGNQKARMCLEKAQSSQKFSRKVENPFGRLVDLKALENQQSTDGPRILEPAARQAERTLVQDVTKKIRRSAKDLVPLLEDSLPGQLHRLERIVLQTDSRLSSAEHIDFFSETMADLEKLNAVVAAGLNEIREHLRTSADSAGK